VVSVDLGSVDLVLAMAREHVEYVRRRHPEAAARTGTLKRLARDLPALDGPLDARVASLALADVDLEPWEDVEDPAGGDVEVFRACAREIHDLLARLGPLLRGEVG
jgi:protein-tyrosine-phosphatase